MTNKEKRLSRCTALQILYGNELADAQTSDMIDYISKEYENEFFSDEVVNYSVLLVTKAIRTSPV